MTTKDFFFDTRRTLDVNEQQYTYHSIHGDTMAPFAAVANLPVSIKILLENLLRHQSHSYCTKEMITTLIASQGKENDQEIIYHPTRILMQDFTGVPAIVDLAAMRDTLVKNGVDPQEINPKCRVDLVIDHSVTVNSFGSEKSFAINVAKEMEQNAERYRFLKWGQNSFHNFNLVPPGNGICHQVNLEYLAKTVWDHKENGIKTAYPDTLVGTDSHTTMINGLGVLGWGVGGIEAEAAMLGQAISMQIPDVIGFELSGQLQENITATDLVLQVVAMLRRHGVVGKFVEFYGSGLDFLPLADRATLANMAPEYGATCGFFPVDSQTISYLHLSGRSQKNIDLVTQYCMAQGMWRDDNSPTPTFASTLHLDMSSIGQNLAGPSRPYDRVSLADLKTATDTVICLPTNKKACNKAVSTSSTKKKLQHGDVVIAAITSCTNTSNPAVMLAAGLLAKKAVAKGLSRKPWVKSSLAPGSKVVGEYLNKSGLQTALDCLGFNLVAYGCTTCIGNSGPLIKEVEESILENDLLVSAVLSGNRNFEGRIHPLVKASWLASPPLVVAYALAGSTRIDLSHEPIGNGKDGNPVYLKDIWPSKEELEKLMRCIDKDMFQKGYKTIFEGDALWEAIPASQNTTYPFPVDSTYIQRPPFFEKNYGGNQNNITGASFLAILGDNITTDHISPAGTIPTESPAGKYLYTKGVSEQDFNSYGSRRGNHKIMMRGTFGNIRIQNEMLNGQEGGYTRMRGEETILSIYDAAMQYQSRGFPTVIVAGKEYGTGSSRDWAAKGTLLLGVKAVLAESFERIHRSNLAGMGVLPLQFMQGDTRKTLRLSGDEQIDILGLDAELTSQQHLLARIQYPDGKKKEIKLLSRLDTAMEVNFYQAGGVLRYVLDDMIKKSNENTATKDT